MNSTLHSTPPLNTQQEEPKWELVRVVVMRDNGLRPRNFKEVVPADDNTYVGRCRYYRADGGSYWCPAHLELRQDLGNSPAHLLPPLFDPVLVKWLGTWQIFAGWVIVSAATQTHEYRQLWAISRDLGD